MGSPFRFPGQYADAESGLFYNRHRYYDPELRMYITPDPLGLAGSLQPYTYVPDPMEWIDPLGLRPGKKVCWVDGRGRKQVVITFPTRKKARDARPRPKPQKPKAEGGQRTTRQTKRRRGEGAKGEKHRRGGTHVHDDRHTDTTKPNIHYEFPE
jgi:RHS repeat-associated protein